jgi:phage baseplate assembly protein W
MFYKKIILSLFLSAINVLSATMMLPRNIPQHGRQQACDDCEVIAESVRTILRSFKDSNLRFFHVQSQCNEIFRQPCSCTHRADLKVSVEQVLVRIRSRILQKSFDAMRAEGHLFLDIPFAR